MIATLPRLITSFDRRYPGFRDPERASMACALATGLFCQMVPGAREAHLWGSRRYFPNRVDEYPALDPGFYHVVAVVRGLAIDWTRRQLDPRAAHPFIQPVAELRRDWIRVGPSPEYIGL